MIHLVFDAVDSDVLKNDLSHRLFDNNEEY